MEHVEIRPHPLLGFRLLENLQQPSIAVIAFHTQAGDQFFAATREILADLAEAFQNQALKMPHTVQN